MSAGARSAVRKEPTFSPNTHPNLNPNPNANANDTESLQVHPGSPPTISPPAVSPPALKEQVNEKAASLSTGTDDSDLKGNGDGEDGALPRENEKVLPPEESRPMRFTIDPAGELTHDATTVDVVTVPCPGGHPLRSWNRDGLMSRYFGARSMRDAEVADDGVGAGKTGGNPSWVRQGIRREADRARILLYEHPEAVDGTVLGGLADSLLDELQALRNREEQERPVVFIGHGIGGLVVKMALVKASRDTRYENILRECYGVAFFGTPHQGSSYFSMPSLASSIQSLLQLSSPLPASITDDLRVGNSLLAHVDADFKTISNDLRVWSFYETIDSRLSGSASGDVYFTAPLSSIKSTILGMRQEHIFPLQSDHANIASFGRNNVQSLRLFMKHLSAQIARADASSGEVNGRWTLSLEQKVNVEVHGFFDDACAFHGAASSVRAWSTKLPLRDFLNKGPEACLSERLNEVDGEPEEGQFLRSRGRTSLRNMESSSHANDVAVAGQFGMTTSNPLGIRNQQSIHQSIQQMSPPVSPVIRPVDAPIHSHRTESAPEIKPDNGTLTPPSRALSGTRYSTPMRRPSPLIRADMEQDLAVDRLSPPLRGRTTRPNRSVSRSLSLGSDKSRFEYRDFPPFSQRSRSTFDGPLGGDANIQAGSDDDDDGLDFSPLLPEAVTAIRKVAKSMNNKAGENAVVEDLPAAFAKPEVKERKFVWIHLAFNDPTWVKNVLQTLEVCYKKDYSSLYGNDFWATKHTRGRHSQHYAYFAKPGCYFTAPRTMSPRSHSINSTTLSPLPIDENMYTCLFLPYLHFDSYKRLIRRRDFILKRLAHGRSRPIPEYVAKSDSLELQVVWEHLGHDPPINCRRTLDQYAYPSLRDTRSRDDDQMLYKLTKERACVSGQQRDLYDQGSSTRVNSDRTGTGGSGSANSNGNGTGSWREQIVGKVRALNAEESEEEEVLNGNVLMVDQLWLWALNSHTLLTFFPKRESDPIEGPLYQQADLRDSIFNEVNVDLTRQCENALDLAALAALHAVSVLLDRASHPDLEVFRIFEEAISALTEKLTSSLKEFRTEGVRDKAFDYEPVENKARSIRARHKEEGRRAERDNRDNTSALLELRDIEDELLTLLHLFERQSKVISSMHAIYTRPEVREQTVNGRVFLNEALKRLGEYVSQADEMIQRVRSTRDDYDKLLQMVQRQAQVDEVRLSRLHADLASAQSRSVMIFTTFTVIFLPLTFFTGLFGMNTHEWGGQGNLPLRTIGAISLPASAFLIVASLVVAWSTNVRRFFRWISKKYGRAQRWLYFVLWRPAARILIRAVQQQRRKRGWGRKGGSHAGEDTDGLRSRAKREVSDFWERHRMERESGYQIPQVNIKSAGRVKSVVRGRKKGKGEEG